MLYMYYNNIYIYIGICLFDNIKIIVASVLFRSDNIIVFVF